MVLAPSNFTSRSSIRFRPTVVAEEAGRSGRPPAAEAARQVAEVVVAAEVALPPAAEVGAGAVAPPQVGAGAPSVPARWQPRSRPARRDGTR